MSQYKMKIIYIKGGNNCVANTLSQLLEKSFLDECLEFMAPHECWQQPIGVVLSIVSDRSVLASIKSGYDSDPFCVHLAKNDIPGVQLINGLWYVGNCLVVPCVGDLCENLYHLAHDPLGHFGADKS